MMLPIKNLRVQYWGVTGAMNRVASPRENAYLAALAMQELQRTGQLQKLLQQSHETDELALQLHETLGPAFWQPISGATTCIEVSSPDTTVILDAGGGLVELGQELESRQRQGTLPREIHLCLSHLHLDHLFGLPLCRFFYDPTLQVTIWAAPKVLQALDQLMSERSALHGLVIPTTLSQLAAVKSLQPILPGQVWQLGSIQASCYALNHPGGSLAFRLQRACAAFVMATDHEMTADHTPGLIEFLADADLYYADAQYRAAEYHGDLAIGQIPAQSRQGWGHSSEEQVIRAALAAQVRRVDLGHLDPSRSHTDCQLFEQQAAALANQLTAPEHICPVVRLARSGQVTEI